MDKNTGTVLGVILFVGSCMGLMILLRQYDDKEPTGPPKAVTQVIQSPVALADTVRPVFSVVEQMPEFPGDLKAYIEAHLRYPAREQKAGIEGRTVIRFVVLKDGAITDPGVVRSSGNAALDQEAVRLVRAMPPWRPGKQNGTAVDTYFTLPITFTLE